MKKIIIVLSVMLLINSIAMATDILVTPEKYAEIQIPTSITTSTVIHFQYQNYNYDAIIILFNDCPDNDLFIL